MKRPACAPLFAAPCIDELRAEGIEPFPTRAARTHTSAEAILAFEKAEKAAGESGTQAEVKATLAGRIRATRAMGKVSFAHIEDGAGKIQLFLRINELSPERVDFFNKMFDIGDFIQASGVMMRTKTGEATLHVHDFNLLAKSVSPLPASKDEKMEDDEKKARKAKKAASVVGLVRALTGTRDKAAQLGRLDAMAEKAKMYDAIAQDVAKMKASERSQRVDALIKRAIDERKISSSNKRQIEFLRAQGMESPKRLAAYVEAMPRIVQRTSDEGPMAPATDGASAARLSPQALAIIEQAARASNITVEKATAEYLAAYNRANPR